MLDTIKIFYGNLSKGGRIVLWVVLQLLVLIILVPIILSFFQGKERIEIENGDSISSVVPESLIKSFKETLWELISDNVPDADRSVIDDVVVRDDSYEELVDGNAKSVTFIIDIDSIQQTFVVSIGWSEDLESGPDNNISINCPPINKMKYPGTVCYGMYNNTYSLDLYLPYAVYPEGYEDDTAFVMELFEKSGVLCTPGSSFGSLGKGHVRFALTLPVEIIKDAIDSVRNSNVLNVK